MLPDLTLPKCGIKQKPFGTPISISQHHQHLRISWKLKRPDDPAFSRVGLSYSGGPVQPGPISAGPFVLIIG